MVDAYSVMEEELFMELPYSSAEKAKRNNPTAKAPAKAQAKCLYLPLLLALAGFVLFLLSAFALRAGAAGTETAPAFVQALSEGRGDDAILEMSAASASDQTESLFWLAWLCGQDGKTDQQIDSLEQILASDPENIYACRDLIHIYVAQNDFESLHELYGRYADSSLAGLFTDYLLDAPEILAQDARYFAGDTISIQAEPGENIYYTLDGASPITNGTLYYAPIVLAAGDYELRAVACNEKGYYSTVSVCQLSVAERYQLGMPQVTPNSGEYLSPQTIHINVPAGCTAYYSWNGTPTTASRKYDGSITMPEGNNVLSVILVDEYGNTSSVQRMNYIYMP
jgi:hypothetical protein